MHLFSGDVLAAAASPSITTATAATIAVFATGCLPFENTTSIVWNRYLKMPSLLCSLYPDLVRLSLAPVEEKEP